MHANVDEVNSTSMDQRQISSWSCKYLKILVGMPVHFHASAADNVDGKEFAGA